MGAGLSPRVRPRSTVTPRARAVPTAFFFNMDWRLREPAVSRLKGVILPVKQRCPSARLHLCRLFEIVISLNRSGCFDCPPAPPTHNLGKVGYVGLEGRSISCGPNTQQIMEMTTPTTVSMTMMMNMGMTTSQSRHILP
jgi:hypothetical protein